MRTISIVLSLLALALPATLFASVDSVKVSDHSIVGMKSHPGLPAPDIFLIKLEVEYAVRSTAKASLKFAIDSEVEMEFITVDRKEVVNEKRIKKKELTARLDAFSRDVLRGVVLIEDPDAPDGAPPLAITGVSLDLKKFRKG